MNYLHPDEPERNDTLEEHIFCNQIFVRALSFLLKEENGKSEGVVIVMNEQKFLVHADEKQIKISTFEEDLPEGTLVWFHRENTDDIVESDKFKQFCIDNNLDIHSADVISERMVDEYLHAKWLQEAQERGDSEESIQKTLEEFKMSLELKYGKSEPGV